MAKGNKRESEEQQQVEMKEEAYTMRLNTETGMFQVVKVMFDFDSGEAKVDSVVSESKNEYKTLDALKLCLGKYLNKLRMEK